MNISINGSRLKIEHEIKYLGVIFDDKLKFEKNTSHLCKKLGQKLSVISRLRKELNCQQKLNLYKSIVQPHFNYCASVLFLSKESDINRLQKIQNKFMRQILKTNKFESQNTLLSKLQLLSVKQAIYFRTFIFIYKIINGKTAQYLTNRIRNNYDSNTHSMTLRNANEISLTNSHKLCSQNSLFYRGVQLFNALPIVIKEEKSSTRFQKLLYKHICDNF